MTDGEVLAWGFVAGEIEFITAKPEDAQTIWNDNWEPPSKK